MMKVEIFMKPDGHVIVHKDVSKVFNLATNNESDRLCIRKYNSHESRPDYTYAMKDIMCWEIRYE